MAAEAGTAEPKSRLEEQATAKGAYSYSYFASGITQTAPVAAPRKLTEQEAAAQQEAAKQRNAEGSSAWNHAGTFEERDWTDWAKGRMSELITDTTYESQGTCVRISKVVVDKGHANSWFVRGKKRHGYDFEVTLHWCINTGGKDVTGTCQIPNAASDELDDLSLNDVSSTPADPVACKAVNTGMLDHLRALLETLLEELKQK